MNPALAFNPRVLSPDVALLSAELGRLGAASSARDAVLVSADLLPIHLENVPGDAASALSAEAAALGISCVFQQRATDNTDTTSVLLVGPRSKYPTLIARLERGGAGLTALNEGIADLLALVDRKPVPVQIGQHRLPVGERTLVMGILNVTPDSFSGDSLGDDVEAAVEQARRFQHEGAEILDVGGQSTRPGSESVSIGEELRRVIPVVQRLAAPGGVPLPISVDTSRAAVAEQALSAGAHFINDITGLRDEPEIAGVVARHDAGLVLMHIQGVPRTMQQAPHYDDLLGEVIAYLRVGVHRALDAGVPRERIWVDPGIGFGKTLDHNLELLRRLGELRSLGCAVLVGTSRKSFIGRLIAGPGDEPVPPPSSRVVGTGATLAVSIANGADIVRVHDVAHAVEVCRVADAIVRGRPSQS